MVMERIEEKKRTRTKHYIRTCRKCYNIYQATGKYSKMCEGCKKRKTNYIPHKCPKCCLRTITHSTKVYWKNKYYHRKCFMNGDKK